MASYEQPLEDACAAGNVEDVSSILSKHPEAKQALANDEHFTSRTMSAAVAGGSAKVVQTLLDAGADPNTSFGHQGDALISAVRQRNTAIAELLLQAGYKVNDVSKKWASTSPLAVAALTDNDAPTLTELLMAHGATIPQSMALHNAAAMGNLKTVDFLLAKGADVNENPEVDDRSYPQQENLGTPLHFAVDNGKAESVKLLLGKGADPAILDRKGRTVLQRAQERNAGPEVEKLLGKL